MCFPYTINIFSNIESNFENNFEEYIENLLENLDDENDLYMERINLLLENGYCNSIIQFYQNRNIDIPNCISFMIYKSSNDGYNSIIHYYTNINNIPSNEFLTHVAKNNLEDFFLITNRKDINFDINLVPGIKLNISIEMYDIFNSIIKYCKGKNLVPPPKLVENTEMRCLAKLINRKSYSNFRKIKILQYIFASKFFTCIFANGLDLLDVDDELIKNKFSDNKKILNLYYALKDVNIDNHPIIKENILQKVSSNIKMIPIVMKIIGREKSHQLITLFEGGEYSTKISDVIYKTHPLN